MINRLATDLESILEHTGNLWEELRGQRLFITGGTGFVGSWILESFAWANRKLSLNAKAMVLTRDAEDFTRKMPLLASDPSITFVTGDVRSFEFPDGAFSHIIHAANQPRLDPKEHSPLLVLDTSIEGTRRVLDFAVTHQSMRLMLISTGAVYGCLAPGMSHISEDCVLGMDTLNPNSAYGEGKRCAELLCFIYALKYGIQLKIARCFSFVGPYLPLNRHYAIGNFIRDGLCGGPIVVEGDGTAYRSYLYARDLAIWLWTILFKGTPFLPYNVGSDEEITILDLARRVAEICNGLEIRVARPPSDSVPERYVPDVSRAKAQLGLRSTVQLTEAIRRTLDYYQALSYPIVV